MKPTTHYQPKRLAPASVPPPSYGGPGAVGPQYNLYILPDDIGVVTEEDLERFPPIALGDEAAARAFLDRAMADSAPKKRGLLRDVLFYAALALLLVVVLIRGTANSGAPVTFAGFSAMRVLTSSMQDVIPQGSLIITRHVDPNTLEVGDDVTYMAGEGVTVTHRIVDITENYQGTGHRAFTTQGVMNSDPDSSRVPAANIVGKVIFHNLFLGQALAFIRAHWTWLALLLGLILAFLECIRVLVRETKAEKEQ